METNHSLDQQIDILDEERKKLQDKNAIVLPTVILIPSVIGLMCFLVSLTASIFAISLLIIFAIAIHTVLIAAPFDDLKYRVREYLLKEFMDIYHPNIDYHYQPTKDRGQDIVKSSKLVSCTKYHEEDVIAGAANNIDFYLSEIRLTDSSGEEDTVIFKGILFKLKLPGRNFPTAQIQSKLGLLKTIFGNFVRSEEYNFYYDTQEPANFEKELGPFFPFIRHLIQQRKDLRIHTKGDEITILMESDMNFLDDPKPSLNRSFKDKAYYEKIGQQINSLLFIVETFAGKLDKKDVVERLELKELEYRKLGFLDQKNDLER